MPDLETLLRVSFALILVAGANARVARLFTKDEIMARWRAWVKERFGYQSMLTKWSECPWCLGWWTAIPATSLAWWPIMGVRMWWLFPAALFAVAHAAGRWNHNHAPVPGTAGK